MASPTEAAPGLRVSVVIPTLNEARNLPHVLARLPPDLHEIIIVDGYSDDDTLAVARHWRPEVRIVMQTGKGKGNALACGCAVATGDVIATIDADGSSDPAEIPRFVQALADGADFAKGSRFLPGGGSSDITRLRSLGNRMLCGLVNICFDTKYSDLCYGFNVFWRRIVPILGIGPALGADSGYAQSANGHVNGNGDGSWQPWGAGFEVETLLHIRVAKAALAVTEVPSFEHARIHGVSNLHAYSDGMRVLRTILAERKSQARLPSQPAAAEACQTLTERISSVPVHPPGRQESARSAMKYMT